MPGVMWTHISLQSWCYWILVPARCPIIIQSVQHYSDETGGFLSKPITCWGVESRAATTRGFSFIYMMKIKLSLDVMEPGSGWSCQENLDRCCKNKREKRRVRIHSQHPHRNVTEVFLHLHLFWRENIVSTSVSPFYLWVHLLTPSITY